MNNLRMIRTRLDNQPVEQHPTAVAAARDAGPWWVSRRRVLLGAAGLIGACAIVPVITARSLVREAPDAKRQARWQSIMREATEQSGRGVLPELRTAMQFAAALDAAEGTKVMAYEGERGHDLRAALRARPTTVSVFIGPEGGYEPGEAECARVSGAELITLADFTPGRYRTRSRTPRANAWLRSGLSDRRSGSVTRTVCTTPSRPFDSKPGDTDVSRTKL